MEKKIVITFLLISFLIPSLVTANNCIIPNDNIQIKENTLICEGTFKLDNDFNGVLFEISGNNLFLDCNNSTIIGNKNSQFAFAKDIKNVTIKNCNIKNFDQTNIFPTNIYLITVYNFSIINTKIYNNKSDTGIYITDSDKIIIEKVDVYSAKNVNIEIEKTDNVIIDECVGHNPGQGSLDISKGICYRLTHTENSIVQNSRCYNAQHSSFTYRNSKNSSFINNYAYNTTEGNNIWIIDNCSNILISNNTLNIAKPSNILISDSKNCKIFNNHLGFADIGIMGKNSNYHEIHENIIKNYSDKPIYFMESYGNKIKNNEYKSAIQLKIVKYLLLLIAFLIIIIIFLRRKRN
jgi:hypothetical protein